MSSRLFYLLIPSPELSVGSGMERQRGVSVRDMHFYVDQSDAKKTP